MYLDHPNGHNIKLTHCVNLAIEYQVSGQRGAPFCPAGQSYETAFPTLPDQWHWQRQTRKATFYSLCYMDGYLAQDRQENDLLLCSSRLQTNYLSRTPRKGSMRYAIRSQSTTP